MLFALSALAGGAAHAQGQVQAGNDAVTPQALGPQAMYESAFEGYRAYRDQDMASWRDLNDEAARVGGHAGVLRSGAASKGTDGQEKQGADAGKTMHDHQGMHRGAK